jgi:hypothetical protein
MTATPLPNIRLTAARNPGLAQKDYAAKVAVNMISCAPAHRTATGAKSRPDLLEQWMRSHGNGLPLSSNQSSLSQPFQRWFKLKEAFSPQFIIDCVRNAGRHVNDCLDPFGGSGTSALTCQFLGVKPTTIEVNPFLADLIEAKLATYNLPTLERDFLTVLTDAKVRKDRLQLMMSEAPATLVEPGSKSRWVFSRSVAQRIVDLNAAIETIDGRTNRRLLRIILGSILLVVSNVTVNGKGRRYRGGWERRSCSPEVVDEAFRQTFRAVVHDLKCFGARACPDYRLIRGDCRKRISLVEEVDLAIFSPPYPNSFDYTDIYNLELWMLGYLKTKKDNSILRNRTLRSHVQIKRSFDTLRDVSPTLDAAYDRLVALRGKLWNPHIPEMLSSYFCDIASVLAEIHSKLRQNGRIFMAIGSSKYKGVLVDVPSILIEIATASGLNVVDSAAIRSMRASAQQGGRKELSESVIVFS